MSLNLKIGRSKNDSTGISYLALDNIVFCGLVVSQEIRKINLICRDYSI
jgi:hypothetical protein